MLIPAEQLGITSMGHRIKIIKQITLDKQKQQSHQNSSQLAQQQWIDAFKHHSQQMVDLLKQQFQQQLYLQQQVRIMILGSNLHKIMDTFKMQQDQLNEFRKDMDRVKVLTLFFLVFIPQLKITTETGKLEELGSLSRRGSFQQN